MSLRKCVIPGQANERDILSGVTGASPEDLFQKHLHVRAGAQIRSCKKSSPASFYCDLLGVRSELIGRWRDRILRDPSETATFKFLG